MHTPWLSPIQTDLHPKQTFLVCGQRISFKDQEYNSLLINHTATSYSRCTLALCVTERYRMQYVDVREVNYLYHVFV